jgi:predicted DNA-binding transcriptional regulator AlpA
MPLDGGPTERTWAKRAPPKNPFVRRAEMLRVLYRRHEAMSECTREEAFALCVACARCGQPDGGGWMNLRNALPQFAGPELEEMMAKARRYSKIGRGLGKLIGLTAAEKVECRAWHLESVDGPTREETRKLDATVGRRERRAAKGAQTRADYLAAQAGSERKTKPWERLGIGKRWYYVLKRRGELPTQVNCAPGAPESYDKTSCVSAHPVHTHAAPVVVIRKVVTMDRECTRLLRWPEVSPLLGVADMAGCLPGNQLRVQQVSPACVGARHRRSGEQTKLPVVSGAPGIDVRAAA